MAYPIKEAKYAGEDRAAKLCRAEGGAVSKYPNKIPGLTDEQIDANEARRPKNWSADSSFYRSDTKDIGDRMEATPSESNKPEFLRGLTPAPMDKE